jgi:mono/diheme cytochrome c family protein
MSMIRALLPGGLGLVLLAAAAVPAVAQAGNDPFLPPGENRDLVVAVCTSCHPARTFGQIREGAAAWRYQVYDMIMHGAQMAPEDIDPVVKYLSTALGPGVPLPGPPPASVSLPDGQGKELVEGACALCHGLDRVAATKRPAHQWDAIVQRMIFFGAPLSSDQAKTVSGYLATDFGSK